MNLLTATQQRDARVRLTLVVWRSLTAYTLMLAAVSAALLLAGRTILERHFHAVVEQSSLILRTQEGAFRNIRAANELFRVLDETYTLALPWTRVLRPITDGVSNGVVLTRITVDRNDALHLEGRAATREELLAFQNHLRALPYLRNVAIPFGDFLQRERVEFTVDARIDRSAVVPPAL